MTIFPTPAVLEGEVLPEAVLEAFEMCQMNFAREEHRKLKEILLTFVIPSMGGYENQVARDIARHLEQIQSFSGNYCWRHRHLGASHGVVGKRAGLDEEATV
ncbi:hypothetical protein AL532_06185 [Pseudomonas monteilii]|uniref:hypothetical protein n=1 Tax=Pseudomonas TaxID=286 RepID=UPI000CEB4615|nr:MULTISPECIES: hypothetical protein [Pseudomonas]AVH35919.1 hypothetical protein AL532_06185 [Pseudomonas monteilii]MBP2259393.1 hypothetical protein [Pseudomonas sp. BP8]HDS1734154.1 hypothetical protein [Pseudomonas putida]